jgi:hypothetical protein
MYKKTLVTGFSLHRGPVGGTWRGDLFTGDFERQVKEGSGNGASVSGGPGEGLLYWGIERYVKEGSSDGHISAQGPCWGDLEGGLLHRGLRETGKRRLWKRSVPLYGGSERGTWRVGAPLLGNLKDV